MRLMMKRGGHPTDTSQDYDYTDWDSLAGFALSVSADGKVAVAGSVDGALSGTTAKSGSDSFVWKIRWETIERSGDAPLYGALLPDTYPSLADAQREQQRLEREQPIRSDPIHGGEPRPVHYAVAARNPTDGLGL